MNKLFQDTNYKLSDLFNELSPSLILNNNNNTPYSTPINSNNQYQSTQLYTKLNSTPTTSSNSNSNQNANVFQQFPTFTSSPSSIQLQTNSNASTQMNTPTPPARQLLLQTTNTNPNTITNSSFVNRFPNPPFNQNGSATISSTTSKFYNNFYRNPIKTTADQCKHLNIWRRRKKYFIICVSAQFNSKTCIQLWKSYYWCRIATKKWIKEINLCNKLTVEI